MPTVVRSDANGNVVLPARAVLAGLPEQLRSRHGELGLRHPLGTYNTLCCRSCEARHPGYQPPAGSRAREGFLVTRNHQNKWTHCSSPKRLSSRA